MTARAGTTTPFSTGKTITSDQANFGGSVGKTVETGSFNPNAFGLHDMHGNVWEWVEDCYADSYKGAPVDGAARTTSCTDEGSRILRGGSWYVLPYHLRSASRGGSTTRSGSDDFNLHVGRTLTP